MPRRGLRRLAVRGSFLLPAAAAAAVVAVVLGATALAHGFSGTGLAGRDRTSAPSAGTQRPRAVPIGSTGPGDQLLAQDPAISAIIQLDVTHGVTTWAWFGQPSLLYWLPYISTGPQFCHWAIATSGEGSGDCWPLPSLSAARPAVVIDSNDAVGIGHPVISGVAEPDVAAVAAVFPDGQHVRGVIGTGRGFPAKAWSVTFPTVKGTKLVFTGAAGQILATLSTAAPAGPIALDLPQPAHGGVAIFHYPDVQGLSGGTETAYLVGGHVAFFASRDSGGIFSPAAVSGPPVIAGVAQIFGYLSHGPTVLAKAFGYANANVVKVALLLPHGERVTTSTVAAGWPGSDVQLWQVSLPTSAWKGSQPKITAIAYNAAGQVIGKQRLAQPLP
ncbi:MAG TPA: hypothetical protein VHZ33_02705 [Trebonia sp.]|nr:hypothetical protein [Trebonia sp.]